MKRGYFIGGALALVLSTPAHAEWFKVATSTNKSVWYMDPERMKVDGQKVQAWVRIDSSHDNTVKWSEEKQLMKFDCSAQTYQMLSSITYDTYGKVLTSRSYPDYGSDIGYEPVVPESVAEAAEQAACVLVTGNH